MKKTGTVILLVAALSLILITYGCGKKNAAQNSDLIIARINNYELTTDDFAEEERISLRGKYTREELAKAKDELLEEVIVKNILIQEAQAQNFDKNKAFMKEIEKYWEQALLKLLIKKKMEELARGIPDDIGRDAKRKKVTEELDKWISGLRKKAVVKVNKKVFDEMIKMRGAHGR